MILLFCIYRDNRDSVTSSIFDTIIKIIKLIFFLCFCILNIYTYIETYIQIYRDTYKPNMINSVKGSLCSKEGKKYEKIVYDICKKCKINTLFFNTQNESELAGCNSNHDIICNFMDYNNIPIPIPIPIEIKKMKTPDWMQCSLKYDKSQNTWLGSEKNKIPNLSKKIFEDLIKNINLFNGKIPPFIEKNITHNEWVNIKKDTIDYDDVYINCPADTIKKLYKEKGCYYIQISDKGLYHLGEDICSFGVPEFICDQELRVRTKIHTTCNSHGFCKLSVIVACKPKNIKSLSKSNFTLDDITHLPLQLQYIDTLSV